MDGVWCKFRNALTAGSQFRWVALDSCSLNLALENLMRAEFLQLCGVCFSFKLCHLVKPGAVFAFIARKQHLRMFSSILIYILYICIYVYIILYIYIYAVVSIILSSVKFSRRKSHQVESTVTKIHSRPLSTTLTKHTQISG